MQQPCFKHPQLLWILWIFPTQKQCHSWMKINTSIYLKTLGFKNHPSAHGLQLHGLGWVLPCPKCWASHWLQPCQEWSDELLAAEQPGQLWSIGAVTAITAGQAGNEQASCSHGRVYPKEKQGFDPAQIPHHAAEFQVQLNCPSLLDFWVSGIKRCSESKLQSRAFPWLLLHAVFHKYQQLFLQGNYTCFKKKALHKPFTIEERAITLHNC